MKINKPLYLTTALIIIISLSSCGTASINSKNSGSISEASDTAISSADSISKDSSTDSSDASKTETEYKSITKNLITVLNDVDKIGGCGISMNNIKTIKKGQQEYAQVNDSRFKTTADIDKFMKDSLTDKMIASRYSSILGTDSPIIITENNMLYSKTNSRGCGFAFSSDEPDISSQTDSSFTAKVKYDDYGANSLMTINIISDDGHWKIDSVEF